MRLNLLLICFVSILTGFSASATTWTTSNYGLWNSGSSWVGGISPSYTSADTFYIQHPIVIDNQVTLLSGSVFLIDSTGGICGHERMLLQPNSVLHNHGLLELDSLAVGGGSLENFIDGILILSLNAHLYNGGYLHSNGAMAVGPWFICHQPEYSFLSGIEETGSETDLLIYPNPASTELYIYKPGFANHLLISDISGRNIATYDLKSDYEIIPVTSLACGLYVLNFYSEDNRRIKRQKVMIQR